jgi:hypothetical protein
MRHKLNNTECAKSIFSAKNIPFETLHFKSFKSQGLAIYVRNRFRWKIFGSKLDIYRLECDNGDWRGLRRARLVFGYVYLYPYDKWCVIMNIITMYGKGVETCVDIVSCMYICPKRRWRCRLLKH